MTNVQAAIGVAQLEQAPEFLERKAQIGRRYRELAASVVGLQPFPEPPWAHSADWLGGVVIEDAGAVESFVEHMRERGVEARTFWKPMHLQKPYRDAPHETLDISERLWSRIVTLPSSTSLTDTDLNLVCAAVVEYFR